MLNKIVRPGRLVGHLEMTDEQDKVIIGQFRSGANNLLVATDIAQEGTYNLNCFFSRVHAILQVTVNWSVRLSPL